MNNETPAENGLSNSNFKPVFDHSIFNVTPEEFLAHTRDMKQRRQMFHITTANQTIEEAQKMPVPRMLFNELWHENELCILFADTNTGKSILAVQIADSISRGKNILGFKLEAEKQKVLYFDFELSSKQFENRYTCEYIYPYRFDPDLLRASINVDFDLPEGCNMDDYLIICFEKAINSTGARVLIIDNITFLKNETEKAKDALPLMKMLKHLKNKYHLSILVLAHTPKRDMSKPLTRNDLSGSKMLINFCDSAFAIGESTRDKGTRYIKQIKERATEKLYDTANVILCRINKPYNFLQFEIMGYGSEYDHLKQRTEKDMSAFECEVREIIRSEPGLSAYAVAKRLDTGEEPLSTVQTRVKRLLKRINGESEEEEI